MVPVADGFSAYDPKSKPRLYTLVNCWAQLRRKFYELMNSQPVAREAVNRIAALYHIESEARNGMAHAAIPGVVLTRGWSVTPAFSSRLRFRCKRPDYWGPGASWLVKGLGRGAGFGVVKATGNSPIFFTISGLGSILTNSVLSGWI